MATIKKIKKAQTGETLPGVTVTAKKKPNLVERIIGTPEKRAERKEEREGRKAERQSNREVRRYERQDRRSSRCTGSGCASRAGFGGYNKNGGVTKAKSGMKIKKKMQAGGVSKKSPKAPMVDPKGAWTKVQQRNLPPAPMKKGGKVKKALVGAIAAPLMLAKMNKKAEKMKGDLKNILPLVSGAMGGMKKGGKVKKKK